MQKHVQRGEIIEAAAPYDRLSGQGAMIGSRFGVAMKDTLNGVTGEWATEGVYTLSKTSAQAWVDGDNVFWDDTNKRCDNTNVGKLVGQAVGAAANPSSTGTLKLVDAVPQGVFVAAVATANATDLATSEALCNQLKTTVNALQATLVAKGIIAAS